MPADAARRNVSVLLPMKNLGLFPPYFAATLFLALALRAAEPSSAMAPPAADAPRANLSARDADLLKRFDKNGDGKLDEDELADAHEIMRDEQMARMEGTAPEAREKILERFDTNRDGRLDEEERAAMRKALAEGQAAFRARLMERFDLNHDGKLDPAERVAARQVFDDFMNSFDQKK